MVIKNWKKELFTIPNALSLFRLVLIPIYIIIYVNADARVDYYVAGAILAVSCLTDLVDGKIARHFNMVSNVGKVLDPIADKATQFSLMICLALRYRYTMFIILVVLFFVKEFFMLLAGVLTLRRGMMLDGALLSGKICTTVLFVSLILMVLCPDMSQGWATGITVVNCIVLLTAFFDYARVYVTHGSKIQTIELEESPEDPE